MAILDDDIFITAAASFGESSPFPGWLNRAKKTTPPELTVTYMDTTGEIQEADKKINKFVHTFFQISFSTEARSSNSDTLT